MNQVVVGATPLSSRVADVASGDALVSLADRASITNSRFELVADAVLSAEQTPATASPTSATKTASRFILLTLAICDHLP